MNYLLMYDERKQAEEILDKGFYNETYNWKEALLVAKYYRHVLGYGNARIKTEIRKFCKTDPFFHPVPRESTIKNLVKHSKRAILDYTDPIEIRQSELDQIRVIKNFKFQQIALGILAITKRNLKYDHGYLNRYCWRDIKFVVNYRRTTRAEIENCFTELNSLGQVYPTNTTAHKILFIDDESSVVFRITTDGELKRLGSLYKEYCGGILIWCKTCGKETIKKSNRQSLCDECWREHRLSWDRERKRKLSKFHF